MLLLASLSGIQDFLFDVRESGGGQARSLRNRSFRIQLIAECVALRLLEAAGLAYERLMFSAAGKICIAAEGLSVDVVREVREAAADIERRLLNETHGRLRLSVALEERSASFAEQFERASRALVVSKLRPYATTVRDAAKWQDGALMLRGVWDADAEAKRDAEVGRDLVNARWLTIQHADDSGLGHGREGDGVDELDAMGFRVRLEPAEPTASDGLVSCSNLSEPNTTPRAIDRRFFHVRRLARHVPRDERGNAIEFVDLAARARGAPVLGVLKADVDSLGAAMLAVLRQSTGDGLAAMRELSLSLDRFFTDILEAEKTRTASPWNNIYTVFSGGDDMLAVGPWDIVLDFAAHLRALFHARFGLGAAQSSLPTPLTISASVAVIKPRYPVHLAAQQADELLEQAKIDRAPRADQPKDQCAALGGLWKWMDHDAIIGAGMQLADWVDAGIIQRGWLQTLLQLALLRRGQAGPECAAVHPAVATSRLAYHVARNWPRKRDNPRNDAERAGNAARSWIDDILRELDQFDTTSHVHTIHLPAIMRYALLATRSGGSEDKL
jgi:CRISPR-associated protein Csm1